MFALLIASCSRAESILIPVDNRQLHFDLIASNISVQMTTCSYVDDFTIAQHKLCLLT